MIVGYPSGVTEAREDFVPESAAVGHLLLGIHSRRGAATHSPSCSPCPSLSCVKCTVPLACWLPGIYGVDDTLACPLSPSRMLFPITECKVHIG